MKTRITSTTLSFIIFLTAPMLVFAQEYDDMYFSSEDREVKEKKAARKKAEIKDIEQQTVDVDESYSQKNINPEYIAKYRADEQENVRNNDTYAEDEYFEENYNEGNVANNYQNNPNQIVVRDRFGNPTYFSDARDVYWSDPFLYRGTAFDPFYSPWGWNRFASPGWNVGIGFGWNSWGWNRSNVRMGYGWGWGNRWANDPWLYGGVGFYDPWFYDPFFCSSPFRSNVVVINNYETRANRAIRRGVGPGRTAVTSRSVNTRSNSEGTLDRRPSSNSREASTSRTNSNTTGRSRYSTRSSSTDGQSGYYRRSRNYDQPSSASQSSGSQTSRSYSESRSSSSSSNYSRRGRSYDNNSGSSNRSRSYSTPSNRSSRSGSYNNRSSYDRSRSGSYSRPSSGSRSSGYSRPSSGSRSSGSRSYSGGGSRSSGSSRSSGRRN